VTQFLNGQFWEGELRYCPPEKSTSDKLGRGKDRWHAILVFDEIKRESAKCRKYTGDEVVVVGIQRNSDPFFIKRGKRPQSRSHWGE